MFIIKEDGARGTDVFRGTVGNHCAGCRLKSRSFSWNESHPLGLTASETKIVSCTAPRCEDRMRLLRKEDFAYFKSLQSVPNVLP